MKLQDAIRRGEQDENKLTNLIFFARHPERGSRKLTREDPQFAPLAREWQAILSGIVRPALRTTAAQSTSTAHDGAPPTATAKQNSIIFGLDTYSGDHNKNPSWVQAKTQVPISFAIIASNQGVWEDSAFKRDWPKMKDAGIVRGAYLFLRFPHPKDNMQAPDPISQAKALIKTLPLRNLDQSDLPPSLDVEFPGFERPRPLKDLSGREATGFTAQQLLDGVRAAWKVLKSYYGVAPMIYTSGRVWHEDLRDLAAPDLVQSPLWLAQYCWRRKDRTLYCPFPSTRKAVLDKTVFASGQVDPLVPLPWGDSTNWWIHQYQGDADARAFPGFRQVDMNRFNPMQKGASGERVKWVQRRLGIAQNGQFDDVMERALRAFQGKKGLLSNGIIDPRTFAYLCWSNP